MNVGCVRNDDARRSPAGSASAACANNASRALCSIAPPNALQIASTSARVEVSSSEIPSVCASMRRKFIPSATPRSSDRSRRRAGGNRERVEEVLGRHRVAQPRKARLQYRGQAVDAPRDRRETRRPVVDGVHRRDHREQYLRRADVRRRLLAPDVLFARLQREPVRGLAVRVDRHADEAARHRPLELVLRREIAGVRAAVAHRHAEALRRADDDVGAPLAGRHEQRKREEIGGDDDVRTLRMHRGDERAVVTDVAPGARVLQQRAEALGVGCARRRSGDDLDAERRRARAHDVDRLRKHIVGDEEALRLAPRDAVAQRHRLGGGGGFVEHRRVGDGHAGQIAHHRLEIDERLEAPLRYLRLVRRVRGVPRRVLEHVAQDDSRRVRAVIALADEGFQHLVLRGHRTQPGERCGLGRRGGQAERCPVADRFAERSHR